MPWTIDGTTAPVAAATLTPRTLSVSFEIDATDTDGWREYDRPGDYSREPQYGGDWRLIDDQGRSGQTTISPDAPLKPPLDDVTGYVQSYNESQVAPDRIQIDLTVERDGARRDVYAAPAEADLVVPSGETYTVESGDRETSYARADIDGTLSVQGTLALTDTNGPTPWTITSAHGTLALEARQVGQVQQRGSTVGGDWSLPIACTDQQAGAIADAAGIPDAVSERGTPDSEDFVVDTSPDDRQTVTIGSPDRASLPTGDYLVSDWQVSFSGYTAARRWSITLTLQEA